MSVTGSQTRIRLDKWLWYARQVKTRTLAQKMISGGRVRINGEKTTSSKKLVGAQDILTVTLPRDIKILKINSCGTKRGSFNIAQLLYEDLSPEKELRQKETKLDTEPVAGKRPDKRDRRAAQILNGKADLI
ncbi:MAG: RNA-binding protein [Hyphomicrobiales bacterium]|nr:RNA-binding S4 domain-containing protein [Hyphomicrobiales bacterium]PCH49696.1 MAG: RNA-binding protein [Hyphomicrobiales bacterium]